MVNFERSITITGDHDDFQETGQGWHGGAFLDTKAALQSNVLHFEVLRGNAFYRFFPFSALKRKTTSRQPEVPIHEFFLSLYAFGWLQAIFLFGTEYWEANLEKNIEGYSQRKKLLIEPSFNISLVYSYSSLKVNRRKNRRRPILFKQLTQAILEMFVSLPQLVALR